LGDILLILDVCLGYLTAFSFKPEVMDSSFEDRRAVVVGPVMQTTQWRTPLMSLKAAFVSLCLALAGCAPQNTSSDLGDTGSPIAIQPPAKADNRPRLADAGGHPHHPAEVKDPSKDYNESTSPEVDGVRLTVRVPKKVVAGLPLPVEVKLINNGKTSIHLAWDTVDPMRVRIKSLSRESKAVPLTSYGVKMIEPTDILDQMRKTISSVRTWEQKPGKTGDLSVANLGLFYDLTLPGEYTFTLSRCVGCGEGQMAKDILLQVEEVKFTIERP
jgi:hypothetical protein